MNKIIAQPQRSHFSQESEVLPEAFNFIVGLIRRGKVVAIPTDTVYGLATNPYQPEGVQRLFEIKGRDTSKPILLLIGSTAMLLPLVHEVTPIARRLIAHFWPGPLTIIFTAAMGLSPILTGGTDSIGIRFPNSKWLIHLIKEVGGPITATSANLSGCPPATSAAEVETNIGNRIDFIWDGGLCSATPSTVVDARHSHVQIVREGALSSKILKM